MKKSKLQLEAENKFRDAWHRVFQDRLNKKTGGKCPLMLGKSLLVAEYYRNEGFSPDRASDLFLRYMVTGRLYAI